jgi:serine protease
MEDNPADKGQYGILSYRIVLKFNDNISMPVDDACVSMHSANDIIPWKKLTQIIPEYSISRLFESIPSWRINLLGNQAQDMDRTYEAPNFNNYYTLISNNKPAAEEMIFLLNKQDTIEWAYMESLPPSPPSVDNIQKSIPNYQGYIRSAPSGIDAIYAWNFLGGDGKGNIHLIDIEQGWLEHHEDVVVNRHPLTGSNHYRFQDHGIAVLGTVLMNNNVRGLKGITPKATASVVSQWRPDGNFNTADAILYGISKLQYGDILLLQAQAFMENKAWPIEAYEVNFQLIRLATALGIVVIEPAGNGNYVIGNDLDRFTDRNNKNLFDRSAISSRDSGAIMVSASSSTHPYRKLPYANYGNRVNCYAWGENVVTAGNYPGFSGIATNTYTANFGGTSAASAIITGAAIALQSIAEASPKGKYSPFEMRAILSDPLNGTNSTNGHLVDKIGVMPDLKKIINCTLKLQPEINLLDKPTAKRNRINRKVV